MQKFQNMEHSNSRTWLSRAWNFFLSKIQGLSRTLWTLLIIQAINHLQLTVLCH